MSGTGLDPEIGIVSGAARKIDPSDLRSTTLFEPLSWYYPSPKTVEM